MKYRQQIVALTAFFLTGSSVILGNLVATAQIQQLKSNVGTGLNINPLPVQQSLRKHIWDVSTLAFSPDGKKLISGSFDETIQIWDLKQGKSIYSLPGHKDGVNAIAVTGDGATLISGGGGAQSSRDNTISVWSLANLDKPVKNPKSRQKPAAKPTRKVKKIHTLTGHTQGITSLVVSPDGKSLFSASYDKTIKQWDLTTGKLIRTLADHNNWVRSIAIAPDGKTLVSAGGSLNSRSDTNIRFWNLQSGKVTKTLKGTPEAVTFIGFTPNSQKLVVGSESQIQVWNGKNQQRLQTINSPSPAGFKSFAIHPHNQTIATTSLNASVQIWSLNNAKITQTLIPAKANPNFDRLYPSIIKFSPDGNQLAVGHGGGADLQNFPIHIRRL